MTELHYPHLWAHYPHCPHCHQRVVSENPEVTFKTSGRRVLHGSSAAALALVDCPYCGGAL